MPRHEAVVYALFCSTHDLSVERWAVDGSQHVVYRDQIEALEALELQEHLYADEHQHCTAHSQVGINRQKGRACWAVNSDGSQLLVAVCARARARACVCVCRWTAPGRTCVQGENELDEPRKNRPLRHALIFGGRAELHSIRF